MVISKRLFTLLIVLAAAGVGATMYAALLATGMQSTAAAPATAPTSAQPVNVTLDASQLEGLCPPILLQESGAGGGGINNGEIGDFATNSGVINDSQFNDGGFGDIGQQWRQVMVMGPVTNVHIGGNNNATSVNVGGTTAPTGSADNGTETLHTPATTPTTPPVESDDDTTAAPEEDAPPEG